MATTRENKNKEQLWATRVLRWALAMGFLSAVADRFGLWGAPGSAHASWGDWAHFLAYTAQVNSMAPATIVPALAWIATIAEVIFAVGLLLGIRLRLMAYGSAVLLTLFAATMTISFGPKSPLNYSVFVDAAAAWLLATCTSATRGD
jgi:uncharacterized membrane protein YphA (DoxX/SURF4 family)